MADALTNVFSVAEYNKSRQLLRRFLGAQVLESKNGRLRQWQSAGFQ